VHVRVGGRWWDEPGWNRSWFWDEKEKMEKKKRRVCLELFSLAGLLPPRLAALLCSVLHLKCRGKERLARIREANASNFWSGFRVG